MLSQRLNPCAVDFRPKDRLDSPPNPGPSGAEASRSSLLRWCGRRESFADDFRGEAPRDGLRGRARLYAKDVRRNVARPLDLALEIACVADYPGEPRWRRDS